MQVFEDNEDQSFEGIEDLKREVDALFDGAERSTVKLDAGLNAVQWDLRAEPPTTLPGNSPAALREASGSAGRGSASRSSR